MTAYRSDIDGIRAVAVLMVLVFHAYPQEFPAGFAGVDVFFVISGYLISGIIFDELRRQRFSIRAFYERRVRRIFPALIVVLGTTLGVGWLVLPQEAYRQLGLHTMAGAGFVSNLLLWQELGYFDIAAEKKVLLHLWSLGVEEQFYFLAPVFFWGCYRIGILFLGRMLLLATVASLIAYLALGPTQTQTVFYWPHTRFWELLSGSCLAYLHTRPSQRGLTEATQRSALLGALAYLSVFLFGAFAVRVQASPQAFLSGWSVVPVVCTLVWLASPTASFNRRLLALPWLVGIGRISYPLYLWHWVLLSFCHVFEDAKPFFEVRNPALILSFVLAWLTYRYVEKPIRFGRWRGTAVGWLCAAMLGIFLSGMAIWHFDGLPSRSSAQPHREHQGDLGQAAFQAEVAKQFAPCDLGAAFAPVKEGTVLSRCGQSKANVENADTYLVLGDSHAEHLMVGLAQVFPHITWIYSTREGLPVLQNGAFAAQFAWALDSTVRGVVISAHWASKLQGLHSATFSQDLNATLVRLLEAGKEVVLFDDTPIFPFNAERCAYSNLPFIEHRCTAARSELQFNPEDFTPLVQLLQPKYPGLHYVNPSQFVCTTAECSLSHGQWLLYRDRNHLSIPGSNFVAQRMRGAQPSVFR